jgi:hypothetical protein
MYVFRSNLLCYSNYEPARLSRAIDVSLYRATQGRDLAAMPADYGWGSVLHGAVQVHDVEATHYTIVKNVQLPRCSDLALTV